jgi:hypothetical protein
MAEKIGAIKTVVGVKDLGLYVTRRERETLTRGLWGLRKRI